MNPMIGAIIIALLVINLLGLLVVGWRVSGQSNDARSLETRLTSDSRALEARLTKLEARVDNLPTHRDLLDLRNGMSAVVQSIAEIAGRTEAMTTMLQTIQEHLLEGDR
jgi:Tfp pilus assembly protein PilN